MNIIFGLINSFKYKFKKHKTYDYYHKSTFWNDHLLIRKYLNKLATGNPNVDWMTHLYTTYFNQRKNLKVISVICGNGWQDRVMDKIFNFKIINGFDISNDLLRIARAESSNNKYHYYQKNLNIDEIKLKNYDLAVNLAGLHHINKMNHVIKQIYNTLKARGIFVHYEYIGSKRNQYSDNDLKYMNIMQKKFPAKLVGRTPITRPSIEMMLQEDPSEAIGSEKIIPTLKKYFKIDYIRYLNGGMLYQVLYNHVQKFDQLNQKQNRLLQKNIEYEENMTNKKLVKPLFAYIVCIKK